MTTQLHPDLFPETLVVEIADGHTFTTSLKVAKHFGKQHSHVMRAARTLIDGLNAPKSGAIDDANQSKSGLIAPAPHPELVEAARGFTLITYTDPRARKKPAYQMTRNAFSLLVNRFTGDESLIWQVRFNNAFDAMEAVIRSQCDREAQAFHATHPKARFVLAGAAQGLPRAAICQQAGWRSPSTVTRHRQRLRELGLLQAG